MALQQQGVTYILHFILASRSSSMAQPHCLEEDRNFNGMPKFWAWLTTAMYEGTTTVREVLYDMWGTNVSLAVCPTELIKARHFFLNILFYVHH